MDQQLEPGLIAKRGKTGAARRYVVAAIVAVVAAGVVWAVMHQPAGAPRPGGQGAGGGRFQRPNADQPVPILAATSHTADVPVYLDGVGTVKALNTVTVLPQVDGKLVSINFKEGQDVDQGFVLAKIDPTLYQAQYDQAVAKKAQDEALLANARRDLERYTKLAASNALAQQQADTQKSLVQQTEAQVRQDQAAIDNAKGTLDYTDITAPIPGRLGIRMIDVGNVVHAATASGLVVITQLKPISVIFTLPQQQLMQVNAAFAKGPLEADVFGADNKTVIDRGTLQVVDNQVDQATGTIRLKAEFPNPGLMLWPGQFVNVRLKVDTLNQVVVAPTAAVQRGPNGTFVFAVRDDDTVALRPVTITQQDETQTVIASGLKSGERVVTTGFNQLTDGARVTVGTPDSGQPPAAANPNGDRPRTRRNRNNGAAPSDGAVQSDDQRPGNSERRSEREGSNRTP